MARKFSSSGLWPMNSFKPEPLRLNSGVRHMRSSALLLVLPIAGCAYSPAQISSVTSFVSSTTEGCQIFGQSQSVLLSVRNSAPGELRIKAQSESVRPSGWVGRTTQSSAAHLIPQKLRESCRTRPPASGNCLCRRWRRDAVSALSAGTHTSIWCVALPCAV